MIQAKLKLKIMAGYLVLVFCLAFIIRLVHEELGKKSAMKQQETHWQGERRETNRVEKERLMSALLSTLENIPACYITALAETPQRIYLLESTLNDIAELALQDVMEDEICLLPCSEDGREVVKLGVEFSAEERNVSRWALNS